jgi:hypothetical protein
METSHPKVELGIGVLDDVLPSFAPVVLLVAFVVVA